MKLKEYLERINQMIEENPEIVDYDIVYSIDDEGNGFRQISYAPTIGIFTGGWQGDFYNTEEVDVEYGNEIFKPNALCIN